MNNSPTTEAARVNRLIANEIMRRLYLQSERGQLEILMLYAKRCVEQIDEEQRTRARYEQ